MMVGLLPLLQVAWGNLLTSKLRSGLAALGIVIGVATVIALVSVGEGARQRVLQELRSLGTNLVLVSPGPGGQLRLNELAWIRREIPVAHRLVPVVTLSGTVVAGTKSITTTIVGTDQGYSVVRSFPVARGNFLGSFSVAARQHVAVLGEKLAKDLFDARSPLGHRVLIDGERFTVLGVMAPKGTTLNTDNDLLAFVPVTTAQSMAGTDGLSTLYAQAGGPRRAGLLATQLTRLFKARYGTSRTMQVRSQDSLISADRQAQNTMTGLLGAVAAVSLLVGGIGIMNIMLAAVAERTREIGIRKALGARRGHIVGQFLTEAVLLTTTGGGAGVVSGIMLAAGISRAADWSLVLSPLAVLGSLGFAMVVGVAFGLYPAYKAGGMQPVEALRTE